MAPGELASNSIRYTISDLARLYGVSLRTLRFYEEKELLRPVREKGHRLYGEHDRTRLEIILKARKLGFTLATIWDLVESRAKAKTEPRHDVDGDLGLSKAEIDAQVERLMRERARVHRAIEELRDAAARDGI